MIEIVDDYTGQVRDDGEPWPLAMATPRGTVLADTATDLVAYLIDGYDPDDHDKALVARWRTCVGTATDVQAIICADRVQEGKFDPTRVSEDELTALFGDKNAPIDTFDTWDHPDVPLILIATDYAPFSDRPPVGGNVLWLDPSDEMSFLRSLSALGVVELYVHEDAA